jgi:hypothetical protein
MDVKYYREALKDVRVLKLINFNKKYKLLGRIGNQPDGTIILSTSTPHPKY